MFSFFKKKIEEFVNKFSKKVEEKVKKIEEKIKYIEIKDEDIKDFLEELEINLIESDCNYSATQKIITDIRKNLIGKKIERKNVKKEILKLIEKSLEEILSYGELKDFEKSLEEIEKKPILILFFGFNGSGKTTTIAKIAKRLSKKYRVLMVAADTFRSAAIEQLEEWGKRLNIEVFKKSYGVDPAAVIYEAKQYAIKNNFDILLADTAGRSHTNKNLMDELSKIVRVNNPDIKILVLDSLTGNDIVNQFDFFNKIAKIDYVIFTKIDVNEKGGNILSILYEFKVPIAYLGVGQNENDLEKFEKEKFIKKFLEFNSESS
ncbi:MAG: signal recognition particle-docking protein FtsY [Candidatus Aenigmatarchaeota archaeon]